MSPLLQRLARRAEVLIGQSLQGLGAEFPYSMEHIRMWRVEDFQHTL
jgi:hypothetical protein